MRLRISSAALQHIEDAVRASPAVEVCGLLFGGPDFIDLAEPCANVAASPEESFEIDPRRLIAGHRSMREGGARLVGCYHSHPHGPAMPSVRDAAAAAADGALWLIAGGDAISLFRAVAGGPHHGIFERVAYDVVAPGCAGGAAPSEGAQLKRLAGEASR